MKTDEVANIRFFNDLEITLKSYKRAIQKELVSDKQNITFDQWQIFGILYVNPELKQTEIAAKAGKDTASVTRIIELLKKKGYIHREVDEGNRRKTVLSITVTGEKVYQRAREIINNHADKALGGVKAKRTKKLRKMFKRISKNCEQ